jgi:hypothetical protein
VKEQASRGIKAYLLRGAASLLLLFGVCLIPLAFPQRVIIPRGAPQLARSQTSTVPKGGCGPDWRVVASPNSSANTNILFGVAGVYWFGNVWAVGVYYDETFTSHTLTEYWENSAWTVQSSPNPGSTGNQLNAVAGVGAGEVWAVGYFTDENLTAHTLVEYWNGIWNVVPSPDNGKNGNYLQSVTVEASNSVWAVGYYIDENLVNQTLVEHWDGQSWTIIPSPNRGTDGSQLNGITAVSGQSIDLWAVGYSGQGNGVQTLIERWNGSAWIIVDSPNPGTSGNYLQAIAETQTGGDLWAVGYYYESGHPRTLIERWDGASWQVVPSPNVGTVGNSLLGVSGLSANDAWAVGAYSLNNQTGTLQTLTEHWDGNAWNVVPSPNEGTADNILYAATRAQLADWAVGTYSDGINGRTLILEYNDPCAPTPTPTPSECSPSPCFTPTPTGTPPPTPTSTPTPRAIPTPRLRPTPPPRR